MTRNQWQPCEGTCGSSQHYDPDTKVFTSCGKPAVARYLHAFSQTVPLCEYHKREYDRYVVQFEAHIGATS